MNESWYHTPAVQLFRAAKASRKSRRRVGLLAAARSAVVLFSTRIRFLPARSTMPERVLHQS